MPTIFEKKAARVQRRSRASRHSIRSSAPSGYHCFGAQTSQEGRFIGIRAASDDQRRKSPIFIPTSELVSAEVFARAFTARGGFIPATGRKAFFEEACQVRDFVETIIVERPGYDADMYAFPDGEILISPHRSAAAAADDPGLELHPRHGFARAISRFNKSGTRKAYLKGLAEHLMNQPALTFALCVGLTPLLLRWADDCSSFGVQLVDADQDGAMLMLQLAGSPWGRPDASDQLHDAEYFHGPDVDERAVMANDQIVLLTRLERWFALEKARSKLEHVRQFDAIFDHRGYFANGSVSKPTRTIVMAATPRPLAILCGDDDAVRDRLGDRLLTLDAASFGKGGFVGSHETFSRSQRQGELLSHLRCHHGKSARRFVLKLLARVDKIGEEALRQQLATHVQAFIDQGGVNDSDVPARRAAAKFGLIYAAGRLGREVGALPNDLDTDAAVLTCFSKCIEQEGREPFLVRLQCLARDPSVVDLGGDKLPKVTKDRHKAAVAFTRHKGGRCLLYVRPDDLARAIPDWEQVKKTKEVRDLMDREGGRASRHHTVKKKLGRDRKEERVYCFRIDHLVGDDQGTDG